MGIIFGKISVETPKYETTRYVNAPSVVAQVTYDPSELGGDKDGGFRILANYIGAFGQAQNTMPEKIAMTAPVITRSQSEKIAMTAPVITKPEDIAMTAPVVTAASQEGRVTMQFLLPSKYARAEDAPRPTDERVVITEDGERKYGVVKFGGAATDKVVEEKVDKLKKCLERDGHKITGEFMLARYNPPFTIPALRTNEVMIPIE
ncbi:Heme-binding-like protein [Acorus calamus]|uniref:Heme-binding-like protein n=1 Tax=Acorus calamus TaxID=4465 RepID=A0AAV9F369_ACOCL|nr:Heme-binding-like protein [Acorus calamus]